MNYLWLRNPGAVNRGPAGPGVDKELVHNSEPGTPEDHGVQIGRQPETKLEV